MSPGNSGESDPEAKRRKEEDPEEVREREHFLEVCYSIADYRRWSLTAVQNYERKLRWLLSDPGNRELWGGGDPANMLDRMKFCVNWNQQCLLDEMVRDLADCPVGPPAGLGEQEHLLYGILQVPDAHEVGEGNASKTRSTLRQFVRDWSIEGAEEREMCYGPLMQALETHMPVGSCGSRMPKVLTPGCGLGRLTFEVAKRGYHAEGNEFSYHMLLGTMWVLNDTQQPLQTTIYPYVLDTNDRKGYWDNLRPVQIPDVCPGDYCDPATGFGKISMRGGEFVESYAGQTGEWDAILMAFFIDTANNVFQYLRVLADLIRPGGLLINLGPLLWHYSPVGGGDFNAVSIELSWDELRPAIEKYFVIKETDVRDAGYTNNGFSGRRKVYHCRYFVAVRNDVPATGYSKPVH
eukprot:TRINITY_DN23851_c0_g1_i1.p1 TRINITY_DN23851_c0_g1~~TRINITY_DN23851_c0_g1_i1.p1  ORF type:complete len:407 (+),score=53.44 TRINITY_DN23851_c0_g1_i1:76-1296(+)